MFKKNLENLQTTLQKNNIDLAIITDDDSLYYFTGYFDFLHMSFCLLYTSPSPRDVEESRMPSSA